MERADWEIAEESDRIESEVLYYENRRDLLERAVRSFKQFAKLKPTAVKYMNEVAKKRMEVKKNEAIKRNSEKVIKITEQYAAEPEKMVAELTKYNAEKYDHAGDPDGRYVPVNYDHAPNEEIYKDAKKIDDFLDGMDPKERSEWGDLYWEKHTIQDTLSSLRNEYKDMNVAQERVLQPMGLSFDTAINPIAEFDEKLMALTERLNAIEGGRDEKIARYTAEYQESLKTLKTVEDRIDEFAAANEILLPPQLDTEPAPIPVIDIPHEVVEPVANVLPEPETRTEPQIVQTPPAQLDTEKTAQGEKRIWRQGEKVVKIPVKKVTDDQVIKALENKEVPEIKKDLTLDEAREIIDRQDRLWLERNIGIDKISATNIAGGFDQPVDYLDAIDEFDKKFADENPDYFVFNNGIYDSEKVKHAKKVFYEKGSKKLLKNIKTGFDKSFKEPAPPQTPAPALQPGQMVYLSDPPADRQVAFPKGFYELLKVRPSGMLTIKNLQGDIIRFEPERFDLTKEYNAVEEKAKHDEFVNQITHHTEPDPEQLKNTIKNEIEALTLTREFTEDKKALGVIDAEIEALNITLNFI